MKIDYPKNDFKLPKIRQKLSFWSFPVASHDLLYIHHGICCYYTQNRIETKNYSLGYSIFIKIIKRWINSKKLIRFQGPTFIITIWMNLIFMISQNNPNKTIVKLNYQINVWRYLKVIIKPSLLDKYRV